MIKKHYPGETDQLSSEGRHKRSHISKKIGEKCLLLPVDTADTKPL